MLVFGLGTCVVMLLFGGLGDVLTRKYNKYILKGSTMLIITMGLMLMIKGIRLLCSHTRKRIAPGHPEFFFFARQNGPHDVE